MLYRRIAELESELDIAVKNEVIATNIEHYAASRTTVSEAHLLDPVDGESIQNRPVGPEDLARDVAAEFGAGEWRYRDRRAVQIRQAVQHLIGTEVHPKPEIF